MIGEDKHPNDCGDEVRLVTTSVSADSDHDGAGDIENSTVCEFDANDGILRKQPRTSDAVRANMLLDLTCITTFLSCEP